MSRMFHGGLDLGWVCGICVEVCILGVRVLCCLYFACLVRVGFTCVWVGGETDGLIVGCWYTIIHEWELGGVLLLCCGLGGFCCGDVLLVLGVYVA